MISEDKYYWSKRRWRERNIERNREVQRKYREKNIEKVRESGRKWDSKNRDKVKDKKLSRHHPDYSQPDYFITLCYECHGFMHRKES